MTTPAKPSRQDEPPIGAPTRDRSAESSAEEASGSSNAREPPSASVEVADIARCPAHGTDFEIGSNLTTVYSTLATRRNTYDNLLWQVPALTFLAEAFLLTIALGALTSQLARLIAAGLAATIPVLAIQLMTKHRYYETLDSKYLARIEGEPANLLRIIHGEHRAEMAAAVGEEPSWLAGVSGFKVWRSALIGISLVALTVMVISLLHPLWFS